MPVRRIGYACPICDRNGITSHLYEATPALATRCETNGEHVWTDIGQLRELMPRMLELPRPVHHARRVELNVQLPEQVLKNLQAKYGDALNDNLIGVMQYAAQPAFLLIGADDLERIQEKVGCQVNSGSELFGALFRMTEQLSEIKTEIQQLKRASTVRAAGTGILLDLGDYLPMAVSKAAESNMGVEDFLSNYLQESLVNGWVMV